MANPKIKMPNIRLPTVFNKQPNAWGNAVQNPKQVAYHKISPLAPAKDGYPIPLYKGNPNTGNSGIGTEDLEPEPARLIQNTPFGRKVSILPTVSPYAMKGARGLLRASNAPVEAENEQIAQELEHPQNRTFKAPTKGYRPILNENAEESTEDEQADAMIGAELEERAKKSDKEAFEREKDGAANPSNNTSWVFPSGAKSKFHANR